MLQLEGGRKLDPVNLPVGFMKENVKVWIKYEHFAGNSICMACKGQPLLQLKTAHFNSFQLLHQLKKEKKILILIKNSSL